MTKSQDERYMAHALNYASRGLGSTAPNPSVGCVIVKDGHIISRGHTAIGGRPHAEVIALEKAGADAKGATAYVSLEPCSHTGKTGPCTSALIEAGVKRVVVACLDPDPRVSGGGVMMLREAGIDVDVGILEREALALNAGFILSVTQNRPYVTLKLATSNDGMISAKQGARTQISAEMASRYTHLLRSKHDGIMVGSETFLIDNPLLTTRIDGLSHGSKRFVVDARGRVKALHINAIRENTKDIEALLAYIRSQDVTRLLVEGGARLHESFLRAGLVDQFIHIVSPDDIGENGVFASYIQNLQEYGLHKNSSAQLSKDRLDIYTRRD